MLETIFIVWLIGYILSFVFFMVECFIVEGKVTKKAFSEMIIFSLFSWVTLFLAACFYEKY